MAISTVASGSQTCTLTTEHSLHTSTTAGIYVFMVNLVNAANDDVFELRIKTKTLTGDTLAVIYYAPYRDIQGDPIKASPPVTSMFSIEVTLKQTLGAAGRVVPWSLLQL